MERIRKKVWQYLQSSKMVIFSETAHKFSSQRQSLFFSNNHHINVSFFFFPWQFHISHFHFEKESLNTITHSILLPLDLILLALSINCHLRMCLVIGISCYCYSILIPSIRSLSVQFSKCLQSVMLSDSRPKDANHSDGSWVIPSVKRFAII